MLSELKHALLDIFDPSSWNTDDINETDPTLFCTIY